ncbi:MAG TPA: hypothetical protein VIV40_23110 [Kofleriaceae bacterium]
MHTFRGCYHYESSESLDRALEAAREYLDDDELTDVEVRLFAGFRRRGATLFIDATMPMLADRYFASAVLGALAWHARDGIVEAYRGTNMIDQIISAGAHREPAYEWE